MKTFYQFKFKCAVLFVVLFSICLVTKAQSPQYFNLNNGTSNNVFPFGVTTGKKVQWLFLANDFNQPTSAPSGLITKMYFMMGTTSNATTTFTNLTIKMGQSNITDLPASDYYTGQLDTVYYRASVTLTSVASTYMFIQLDVPFLFDSSKSLIVQAEQCGASNSDMAIRQTTLSGNRRCYSPVTEGCPHTWFAVNPALPNCGIDVTTPVGIGNIQYGIPKEYKLEQNYPNPFNPSTQISFSILKSGNVELKVYDVAGREVESILNEFRKAGNYSVEFNASELVSGVYFYTLKSGDFVETKKMVLIK